MEPPGDENDDVEISYLPDGLIVTRRTAYDVDGNIVIRETIEKSPAISSVARARVVLSIAA